MSIMSERAPQDVIREEIETYCLCKVGTDDEGNPVIRSEHCPLHEDEGKSPSEIAQAEVEAHERRLANGE